MIEILKIKEKVIHAVFLNRLNKFLIHAQINEKDLTCHLSDTGRLVRLLFKGNDLLLIEKNTNKKRKTRCEVLAAKDPDTKDWVLINPRLHNDIVEKILEKKLIALLASYSIVKREVKYKRSRFDFLLRPARGNLAFLEIKGCTLFKDNIGYYPDAPTKRGTRHIAELINALNENYEAFLFFLVPRSVLEVRPNWEIDPDFSRMMINAYEKGVKMLASSIILKDNTIYFIEQIPVNPRHF